MAASQFNPASVHYHAMLGFIERHPWLRQRAQFNEHFESTDLKEKRREVEFDFCVNGFAQREEDMHLVCLSRFLVPSAAVAAQVEIYQGGQVFTN